MYALLYGLSALGRRKGLSIKILLPAAVRSGAFLGVFAGLFAVGNCVTIQHLGGNYPRYISFIFVFLPFSLLPFTPLTLIYVLCALRGYFVSAFVAAFCSILIEQRSRRAEVSLHTSLPIYICHDIHHHHHHDGCAVI
jgi:hypothetical protein